MTLINMRGALILATIAVFTVVGWRRVTLNFTATARGLPDNLGGSDTLSARRVSWRPG